MHIEDRPNAELEGILIENRKKLAEIEKLKAETIKLKAEASKLKRESWLYPIFVSAAAVTAYAAWFHKP